MGKSLSVAVALGIAFMTPGIRPAIGAEKSAPGQLQVISTAAVEFEKAQLLYSQGQYAAALDEFSLVVKNHPNDPRREEALFRIAECYRLLNQSRDAQAAYQHFIATCPGSLFRPLAQLRLGIQLAQSGAHAEAVPHLAVAMEKGDPATRVSAKYYLGYCHTQSGKASTGRVLLEELLRDNAATGYKSVAARQLAQSYEKDEKFADALRTWSVVLATTDNKALQACAAARGGWAALQLKNGKEAETLFETCRRLQDTGNWRVLANTGLARLYLGQKRHEDFLGLVAQEKNEFLASARAEILFGTATAQFELKKYAEAAESFGQFAKEFPKSPALAQAAYRRLVARWHVNAASVEADAPSFLKDHGQSPLAPSVEFLYAGRLSAIKEFARALPYWKRLAESQPKNLPVNVILFECARALEASKKWIEAAEWYNQFLAKFPSDERALQARVRLAAAWQNAGQDSTAIGCWDKVRELAPPGSTERQTALEQLGLLHGKNGNKAQMAAAFTELLAQYPGTKLRPLAEYSTGAWAFERKDYDRALAALGAARKLDSAAWFFPATERLALIAFEQKNAARLAQYLGEYDELRLKQNPGAPRLPASLYYWLGEVREKEAKNVEAAAFFAAVTNHPQADALATMAYWRLAECQRAARNFTAAIVNYEAYRKRLPKMADAPEVLVALAQANLGAGNHDKARQLAEQAMLHDLDDKWNAAARLVVGEVYFQTGAYADAAKAFTALGLLYDDPVLTPQAMHRAAQAYEKAGNAASAIEWRSKLKKKYPQWQPKAGVGA
jgi:TolA-binding protein